MLHADIVVYNKMATAEHAQKISGQSSMTLGDMQRTAALPLREGHRQGSEHAEVLMAGEQHRLRLCIEESDPRVLIKSQSSRCVLPRSHSGTERLE